MIVAGRLHNSGVTLTGETDIRPVDSPGARKARGAFFTPPEIAAYISEWAIRSPGDRVLEPSTGDAEFLVPAVARLRRLSGSSLAPEVHGVEIHPQSASDAAKRVISAGGRSIITTADFFDFTTNERYDAVIGNPPFVRYQEFSGEARLKAREAALRSGVALSKLASSWAAFVVHSCSFLRQGGRLGFVLPAELLSVNYAAPVRRFIMDNFASVTLVLFEEQVFPDAEADVVLLLADGYGAGQSDQASIAQSRNAKTLSSLTDPWNWRPEDRAAKWTGLLLPAAVRDASSLLTRSEDLVQLGEWGTTSLGMVTGGNHFFALTDARVQSLALDSSEVMPLSPPGSGHLRGATFSRAMWRRLGQQGHARWLFAPKSQELSAGAREHIRAGETAGVALSYKCRIRSSWWAVPEVPVADLFITYMNAEAPRVVSNDARVRHLNSVHGFYLRPDFRTLGRRQLGLVTLSSISLLSAEIEGRSYGGGMLKLEPKEARSVAVLSPRVTSAVSSELDRVRPRVAHLLGAGRISEASQLVDTVILGRGFVADRDAFAAMREARAYLWDRRRTRSSSHPG